MASRRKFLGMLSTSPIAAKTAADEAIGKLSGISPSVGYANQAPRLAETQRWECITALKNTLLRDQITRMLYEQHKWVSYIDPDLAAYKSFSLNAKITFQRQRNVQKELDQMQYGWVWERITNLIKGKL